MLINSYHGLIYYLNDVGFHAIGNIFVIRGKSHKYILRMPASHPARTASFRDPACQPVEYNVLNGQNPLFMEYNAMD